MVSIVILNNTSSMYDIIKEWHDDFKWEFHVIIMITRSIIIIIVNFSFDNYIVEVVFMMS